MYSPMMQLLHEEFVDAHHVQHLRLLIVAANAGDVLEVAAVMRSGGALASIEHAADDLELIRLLERFVPHVVLTRFADAGVDGMAALTAVQGTASRVPVVMLCDDGDAHAAADALRWGAAACVRRSDWPRLDRVVRDALESGSRPRSRAAVDERVGNRETGYRMLVEATAQIVWHADSEGRICEVSEAFWRYTGLDRGAGPDMMWDSALHPDDRIPARLRWTACVATGEPFRIECRFVQPGGLFRFFEVRALPMAAANGRKARWIGLCMDIDHRKRAVIALQEANRKLQALSRRELAIQEAERLQWRGNCTTRSALDRVKANAGTSREARPRSSATGGDRRLR